LDTEDFRDFYKVSSFLGYFCFFGVINVIHIICSRDNL
jgi:hypothetical protein